MKFNRDTGEIYIPDGRSVEEAFARTTHMGVGAHQDDLEIMAFSGILDCFQREDKGFCGVIVTDGSGSPRDDIYRDYSDQEMRLVRRSEQKKAAVVGEYSALALLDYPSSAVKGENKSAVVEDIRRLIKSAKPRFIYTHNLADKHDTHVGVTLRVIEALRGLEAMERPEKLFGCEVWRDLDWVVDEDKVTKDASFREDLEADSLDLVDLVMSLEEKYDLEIDDEVAEKLITVEDIAIFIDTGEDAHLSHNVSNYFFSGSSIRNTAQI